MKGIDGSRVLVVGHAACWRSNLYDWVMASFKVLLGNCIFLHLYNYCPFNGLSFTLVLDFVLSVPGEEGDPEMTPTLSQTTRESADVWHLKVCGEGQCCSC